jgi:quercetin dioxygenase-like cupin family protein
MTQIASIPTAAAGLADYQKGAVVSRTILKKDRGNVTFFAFDQGQELSEHTAPIDALLYVVAGQAEVAVTGHSHIVRTGELLLLPADQPHSVRAAERFKMLLTMIRT